MYNETRDNIKKSTLVISTIAILLMVTISSTPIMNSSALDLGLISKDTNVGSIDTDNLFNCAEVAITCDNDNTVNNNIAINKGTSQPNSPNPPPDCVQCFYDANLTSDQVLALFSSYEVTSFNYLCYYIGELPSADFATVLPLLGITGEQASTLLECLINAGVFPA